MYLYCDHTGLTSLDISGNTALTYLDCNGSRLITLDISNNRALELLGLQDMPSLHTVCVWVTPFPPEGLTVWASNSPNIYFTTDCN